MSYFHLHLRQLLFQLHLFRPFSIHFLDSMVFRLHSFFKVLLIQHPLYQFFFQYFFLLLKLLLLLLLFKFDFSFQLRLIIQLYLLFVFILPIYSFYDDVFYDDALHFFNQEESLLVY